MAAKSTSGVLVEMTPAYNDVYAFTQYRVDSVSKAEDAVIVIEGSTAKTGVDTSLATPATAATQAPVKGSVITFEDTGHRELDHRVFIITAISTAGTAHTITVKADTSVSTGALLKDTADVSVGIARIYNPASYVNICPSNFALSPQATNTISVGTYCDPGATIPGVQSTYGTLQLQGFVDITSDAYKLLSRAEGDGIQRFIRVTLPSNGFITCAAYATQLNWELPITGAVGYNMTMTLRSKPTHSF